MPGKNRSMCLQASQSMPQHQKYPPHPVHGHPAIVTWSTMMLTTPAACSVLGTCLTHPAAQSLTQSVTPTAFGIQASHILLLWHHSPMLALGHVLKDICLVAVLQFSTEANRGHLGGVLKRLCRSEQRQGREHEFCRAT